MDNATDLFNLIYWSCRENVLDNKECIFENSKRRRESRIATS